MPASVQDSLEFKVVIVIKLFILTRYQITCKIIDER